MKEILRRIKPGRPVFLFLDYDGTLVPIRRTPERAVLSLGKRRALEALGEKVFVCIVSGRSLDDIRGRFGLERLAYIGNHGLEAEWGKRAWVHPAAKRREPGLGRLLKRIEARTHHIRRLLIEDKGVTASVHFRRLDPALVVPLKRIVDDEAGRTAGTFVVSEGKKVFEIRPNIVWDKGAGIRKVLTWLPGASGGQRIFIGDDRTDEDAFRALGRDSITIHVGRRRETRARYRLADVERVWRFLRDLSRIIDSGA